MTSSMEVGSYPIEREGTLKHTDGMGATGKAIENKAEPFIAYAKQ